MAQALITCFWINNLHLWQFDNLRGGGIHHFVTDRSSSEGKEFTLSYSSHPDRNFVDSNRHELAEAMGVEPSQLVGHACLFFLADLDSGRLAGRLEGILEDR